MPARAGAKRLLRIGPHLERQKAGSTQPVKRLHCDQDEPDAAARRWYCTLLAAGTLRTDGHVRASREGVLDSNPDGQQTPQSGLTEDAQTFKHGNLKAVSAGLAATAVKAEDLPPLGAANVFHPLRYLPPHLSRVNGIRRYAQRVATLASVE
jgi:hypothetical protein